MNGEVPLGKYRGRRQPGFVQLLYYNLLRQAPPVIFILCRARGVRLNREEMHLRLYAEYACFHKDAICTAPLLPLRAVKPLTHSLRHLKSGRDFPGRCVPSQNVRI